MGAKKKAAPAVEEVVEAEAVDEVVEVEAVEEVVEAVEEVVEAAPAPLVGIDGVSPITPNNPHPKAVF